MSMETTTPLRPSWTYLITTLGRGLQRSLVWLAFTWPLHLSETCYFLEGVDIMRCFFLNKCAVILYACMCWDYCSVAINSLTVLSGGTRTLSNVVDFYNSTTRQWKSASWTSQGRLLSAATAIKKMVIFAGGCLNDSMTYLVMFHVCSQTRNFR